MVSFIQFSTQNFIFLKYNPFVYRFYHNKHNSFIHSFHRQRKYLQNYKLGSITVKNSYIYYSFSRQQFSPIFFPIKNSIFSQIRCNHSDYTLGEQLPRINHFQTNDLASERIYQTDLPKANSYILSVNDGSNNVRALYIAKKIDIISMFQHLYGRHKNWLEIDCVIVSFPEYSDDKQNNLKTHEKSYLYNAKIDLKDPFVSSQSTNKLQPTTAQNVYQDSKNVPFAVFFDYGAVVFFNCHENLQNLSIQLAERFCEGHVHSAAACTDDYTVQIDESLKVWSVFKGNGLILQKLDINNIRVISSVFRSICCLSSF